MDLKDNDIQISNFTDYSTWDKDSIKLLLGDRVNSPIMNLKQINPNKDSYEVYFPSSKNTRIVFTIYTFLNYRNMRDYTWQGRKNFWKLNISPRPNIEYCALCASKKKLYIYILIISSILVLNLN